MTRDPTQAPGRDGRRRTPHRACGLRQQQQQRRQHGVPWILGTTDTVTALDPAGSYDLGSSTMEYNLYQTLVTVPPNSTKIEGDAAKSCTYSDPKTLTCTLNPGEKFSNGDPLTSADVKYSFDRAIKIQDANGAAIYLLGSITDTAKNGTVTMNKGAITTPDDQTVVFHLDHPDTTFQYVLTYPGAGAIVDHNVFPADKKLADVRSQLPPGGVTV